MKTLCTRKGRDENAGRINPGLARDSTKTLILTKPQGMELRTANQHSIYIHG